LNGYTLLPKKQFYLLLIPLAILIFILSIEVMMRVKDVLMFEAWIGSAVNMPETTSRNELFDIYVTGNLALYFQKIVIPIGLSLHTYFAYVKLRINKLFVLMWFILGCGSLAYTIVGLKMNDIVMYVYILIYLIVIFTLLSLLEIINMREKS